MTRFLNPLSIALVLALFSITPAFSQVEIEEKAVRMDRHFEAGQKEYGISGGFGVSPESDIITDFILLPKWGLFLATFDFPLKGALEFEVEPVLGMHITPHQAPEAGVNTLFTYNFETGTRLVPFFQIGGGFLYTDLRVHELGSRFNGSPQGGLGLKYFLNNKNAFTVQYRFRHVSNAGTADRNQGIDGSFLLFGMDFYP